MKKFVVRLTEEEREEPRTLVRSGKTGADRIRRANILLAADVHGPAWTDEKIAEGLGCSRNTVANVRRRLVLEGLERAVQRKKQERSSRPRKLDGRGEARLVALACSEPPAGRGRWTLQLLADEMVRLEYVDSISDQTVRRTLKKTSRSPIARSRG